MNKKVTPYLFLGILLLILIFILGVKYGKKVEVTNRELKFIHGLTLTPTPSPIPTKPVAFSMYTNKECGIQFLYTKELLVNEASFEAHFKETGTQSDLIYINCAKTSILPKLIEENKLATQEMKLKNQTIKTYVKGTDAEKVTFQVKNPSNGKLITVVIDKNLYPLFENTVQYLP
jgi:hypothetical protein